MSATVPAPFRFTGPLSACNCPPSKPPAAFRSPAA
jgi:hypothetical protein